ncbi:MAG: hypothetical protein WD426_10860 [Anditalea sp.]
MEKLNLNHLSLFLDEEIVIIEDDIRKHNLSEQLKARHAHHAEEAAFGSDTLAEADSLNEPEEEYLEELLKINYEGNFEKSVLIIYQGNQLEGSLGEFLMKILGAVNCSLKDVALVSANHLQELPKQSISQLNPHKCLIFGPINHPMMKLKHENYEIISGEIVCLFADDLKEIADSLPLKKKLWSSLQVLFNINK